jgi:predicted transcriptional regulator
MIDVPLPDAMRWTRNDREYLLELLERCALSQRGAARLLGLNDRAMRYYCSGEQPVPYLVQYALEVMAWAGEQKASPRALAGELGVSQPSDQVCRKCNAKAVTVQLWESSCGGFEDHKYTCSACAHVWWIDGIDS